MTNSQALRCWKIVKAYFLDPFGINLISELKGESLSTYLISTVQSKWIKQMENVKAAWVWSNGEFIFAYE